jgi:hypothetical protein
MPPAAAWREATERTLRMVGGDERSAVLPKQREPVGEVNGTVHARGSIRPELPAPRRCSELRGAAGAATEPVDRSGRH